VLFNGIIIAGVLYFAVQFALTIRRDVDIKVEEQLSSTIDEIIPYYIFLCRHHVRDFSLLQAVH
jgi:hypothetical protein